MTVRLIESKRKKLLETMAEIGKHRGVVPQKLFQYAVGVLGWVPMARPWLSLLWGAITQNKEPVKESARRRKGLVFVKQIQHAVRWLSALVRELDVASPACK